MNNMTSVGGSLLISENDALTTLVDLSAVSSVGTDLTVVHNSSLPQCEACVLLGQLVGFSGVFESYFNQADICSDDCT